MSKLFGSDEICGVVNKDLTCELAFRVGQALAKVLAKNADRKIKIYIGKDTRISSGMIECALAAGISSAGANAGLLGYIAAPAVVYITCKHGADAGVVISCSNDSAEYNGIKIYDSKGFMISRDIEEELEKIVFSEEKLEVSANSDIGVIDFAETARKEYTEHIKNTVIGDISGIKLLVDCANGAAFSTAKTIFGNLDAQCDFISDAPNGVNINHNCGVTDMDKLRSKVVEGGYDLGIAFDGDADRCLAVDENGGVIDGNKIMALCAVSMAQRGKLSGNTFVASGRCNLGLYRYAEEYGVQIETCEAGQKNVLKYMKDNGCVFGGEQSGHIIFRDHATCADGQLTAVQFISAIKELGCKASEASGRIHNYPQLMINVKVPDELKEEVLGEWTVKETIHRVEDELGEFGKISVWASQTEPLVKVLVESLDSKAISELARLVSDRISLISKMKKASKK